MYAAAEVWLLFGGTDEGDGGATQRMWLKIAMGKGAAPGYSVEPWPRPDSKRMVAGKVLALESLSYQP